MDNRSTHLLTTCVCTSTKRKRSARSLIFSKRGVVTRGKRVLTRSGHFKRNVLCSRVSIRHLYTRHHEVAAFIARSRARARVLFSLGVRRAGLAQFVSPTPFIPASERGERGHYSRVLVVRTVKLGGHLRRAKTGTIMNVSKKLSSALTLLIAIHTFSLYKQSRGKVATIAVPKFKAASHACSGTIGLVRDLKTRFIRISVYRSMGIRFSSVKRSPSIRSIACRGSRTQRHARVLVSVTGGGGTLIVKAKSLSRLTLK